MEKKSLSQIIKQRKHLYYLTEDTSGIVITREAHYTDDLAVMAAIRTLTVMKNKGTAPKHATLWLDLAPYGKTQIQGFYKRD